MFNSEIITDFPGQHFLKIHNLSYNVDVQRHIFFKFNTSSSAPAGLPIRINAAGDFCNGSDSVSYRYVISAYPHDPNKKTVDISKICLSETDAVKLTYTVQFQNDGKTPVEMVDIIDALPSELDHMTFEFTGQVPIMNGIDMGVNQSQTNEQTKLLKFTGNGLPGLTQTSPYSYSYDQTIYRFEFGVYTRANNIKPIDNKAEVRFYSNNGPLPSIITTAAHVTYEDQFPPIDCYDSDLSDIPDLIGDFTAIKPNPFQDQINISFELKEKSRLSLEVRDLWGRLIEPVASGECGAGTQQFTWDGTGVPEGVYLIYLRTEKGTLCKKVVKVR